MPSIRFLERLRFPLISAYMLSQSFLVPVVTWGPWPVWLTFSDICITVLIGVTLVADRSEQLPAAAKRLWILGITSCLLCLASYLAGLYLFREYDVDPAKAAPVGALLLYRLFQCCIVFHAISRLRMSDTQRKSVARVATATFVLLSLGVTATYTKLLDMAIVARWISTNLLISGPWAPYAAGFADRGVGFVSYNHGYSAIQLLLAAGFALFAGARGRSYRLIVVVALICTTFLTGSRAGFLCSVIFALAVELRKSLVLVMIAAAMFAGCLLFLSSSPTGSAALERQTSSASSLEDDGFAGRTDIWKDRITFLNAHPYRWVTGSGFGSSLGSGSNSHLLPLHIVVECGLSGLGLFSILLFRIFQSLKGVPNGRVLEWTVIALLLTCLSQETLFPVVAFPQFETYFVAVIAFGISLFPASREEKVLKET